MHTDKDTGRMNAQCSGTYATRSIPRICVVYCAGISIVAMFQRSVVGAVAPGRWTVWLGGRPAPGKRRYVTYAPGAPRPSTPTGMAYFSLGIVSARALASPGVHGPRAPALQPTRRGARRPPGGTGRGPLSAGR
jgi:hypothetical protein